MDAGDEQCGCQRRTTWMPETNYVDVENKRSKCRRRKKKEERRKKKEERRKKMHETMDSESDVQLRSMSEVKISGQKSLFRSQTELIF